MRALTTIDVARRPLPGTVVPTSIGFSSSGRTVTFLVADGASLDQELVAVDVSTGERRVVPTPGRGVAEADLPLEERLRRERARELAVGVTRYQWAAELDRVLVPMPDGLWVVDGIDDGGADATLVAAADDGPLLDARLSGDGRRVAFVHDDEVHVVDVATGERRQVTSGARGTGRTNGLAEFIAQEEMGRAEGFWWSRDGERIAFCEVDETHIPIYRIVHQGSDDVGAGAQEDHAYPFAGAENAHVRVGIVPADGSGAGSPVWLDLDTTGIGADRYVARVDWSPGGEVFVQLQDRRQQRLDLVAFDPTTGAGRLVLREESDVWINLHDHLRFLADGTFLWASERNGLRHLERRSPTGELLHELTTGDHVVTRVVADDDTTVWYLRTDANALERHLHGVHVDGTGDVRLTAGTGVHTAVVHPDSGRRVVTTSQPDAPPLVTLVATDGGESVLHDAGDDPRLAELSLDPPRSHTVAAGDGTPLNALLYEPAGAGPHPTVISVYGGPHAQLVTRSWGPTVALRAQLLRQEGFLVAVVDNRGSTDRGLDFEAHLRHRMGTVEVDDQVTLVRSLVDEGLADPDRVGMYGWSYGGYMSALCLARRPDVFRAACAGAPVTSWDGYDTHYTERYMGLPRENPDGYRGGAVMTHVEGLRERRLLLIHGLIDENVHFRHTARLVNAMIAAGIDHELFLFPDERHVPRREADRVFMEERILAFFRDALDHPSPDHPALV